MAKLRFVAAWGKGYVAGIPKVAAAARMSAMIYNELELSKTLRLSDFRYRIKVFIKIVIAMASTTKCTQSALIAQFASAKFRVATSFFLRSMSVEFSDRVAKMSYPA